MPFNSSDDLKKLLRPYTFALKAGKEFNHDLLDYSLMMLQISCPETIKSPPYYANLKQELGIVKGTLPKKKKLKQDLPKPIPPMALNASCGDLDG